MSGYRSKKDYPERPSPKSRPKSSEKKTGGRKKTWLSDRSIVKQGFDVSPRLASASWYDSPMYKEARLRKWSK